LEVRIRIEVFAADLLVKITRRIRVHFNPRAVRKFALAN
jgi:hypothetical protein